MRKLILLSLLFVLPITAFSFPWTRDMMNQPNIKPQESPTPAMPKGSVPVGGLWTKVADRDAAEEMKNPVAATKKSIVMGGALFNTFCVACHGESGAGDGLVGKLFSTEPADLTSDYVKEDLTDGWLWGTITFGSYVMPRYDYDLSPTERWHIVNYIREVLGKGMDVNSKEERAAEIKAQQETKE